ncbi:MAG: hypothetical protein PHC64_04410 [Candidatus Gastranaerophilales bacterium]|nr:hypothetical protein [Candidatus Gastranaerophilales bacterium]
MIRVSGAYPAGDVSSGVPVRQRQRNNEVSREIFPSSGSNSTDGEKILIDTVTNPSATSADVEQLINTLGKENVANILSNLSNENARKLNDANSEAKATLVQMFPELENVSETSANSNNSQIPISNAIPSPSPGNYGGSPNPYGNQTFMNYGGYQDSLDFANYLDTDLSECDDYRPDAGIDKPAYNRTSSSKRHSSSSYQGDYNLNDYLGLSDWSGMTSANGSSVIGNKLAAISRKIGSTPSHQGIWAQYKDGKDGYCARGVRMALTAAGLPSISVGSAYKAVGQLRANKNFREIKVPRKQLKNLAAGHVIVWDKYPGNKHGHICVTLGNGLESSYKIRKLLNLPSRYHVFQPSDYKPTAAKNTTKVQAAAKKAGVTAAATGKAKGKAQLTARRAQGNNTARSSKPQATAKPKPKPSPIKKFVNNIIDKFKRKKKK